MKELLVANPCSRPSSAATSVSRPSSAAPVLVGPKPLEFLWLYLSPLSDCFIHLLISFQCVSFESFPRVSCWIFYCILDLFTFWYWFHGFDPSEQLNVLVCPTLFNKHNWGILALPLWSDLSTKACCWHLSCWKHSTGTIHPPWHLLYTTRCSRFAHSCLSGQDKYQSENHGNPTLSITAQLFLLLHIQMRAPLTIDFHQLSLNHSSSPPFSYQHINIQYSTKKRIYLYATIIVHRSLGRWLQINSNPLTGISQTEEVISVHISFDDSAIDLNWRPWTGLEYKIDRGHGFPHQTWPKVQTVQRCPWDSAAHNSRVQHSIQKHLCWILAGGSRINVDNTS